MPPHRLVPQHQLLMDVMECIRAIVNILVRQWSARALVQSSLASLAQLFISILPNLFSSSVISIVNDRQSSHERPVLPWIFRTIESLRQAAHLLDVPSLHSRLSGALDASYYVTKLTGTTLPRKLTSETRHSIIVNQLGVAPSYSTTTPHSLLTLLFTATATQFQSSFIQILSQVIKGLPQTTTSWPHVFLDLATALSREAATHSTYRENCRTLLLSALESIDGGISANVSIAYAVLFKLKELAFWDDVHELAHRIRSALHERPTSHWYERDSILLVSRTKSSSD